MRRFLYLCTIASSLAGVASFAISGAERASARNSAESPPGDPPATRTDPLEIPADWFAATRDRTRGISNEERDAYYGILARARDVDPNRLRARAESLRAAAERAFLADPLNRGRKYSQFVQIIQHSDEYRGKPVTLRGYLQGLDTMDAGENEEGLTTLHQAYLFTADSLQNPYVVVCREIPPEIPRPKKGSPTNDVSVTGYFFKVWSYEAERGNWAGPLILADRLEWNPSPPPISARLEFKIGLAVFLALVLGGLSVLLSRQRQADRRFRATMVRDDPAVSLTIVHPPPDEPASTKQDSGNSP